MSRLSQWLFPSRGSASRPPTEAVAVAPVPSSERPTPARRIRPLSLASATRDYARSVENGSFDCLRPPDIARLYEAMGRDLWNWQYARRLTWQTAWRARPEGDEGVERQVASRAMLDDIETWVRALKALDQRIARACLHGGPIPESLAVPAAVQDVLEARKAAALERIGRKRGRGGEDETDSVAIADETLSHPPYPGRPA